MARHYAVPLWSDKHFELMGKSHALMAEVGSRQVYASLGARTVAQDEGLVRWIKQPDGSYKHDFTVFDKYLDMVAKAIGKPFPLRLDCWQDRGWRLKGQGWVSQLDPATGKIENIAAARTWHRGVRGILATGFRRGPQEGEGPRLAG